MYDTTASMPGSATCDIYRSATMPPLDPDVPGVSFQLRACFEEGQEHGERQQGNSTYTHVGTFSPGVDVRDGYTGNGNFDNSVCDAVYVPDKSGTRFEVVFVEAIRGGDGIQSKRVYLDRKAPAWPTNDL